MTGPKISFALSAIARASLAAVAKRAGDALGCTFAPIRDRMYERGEAMAASVLGLHVTLSHDPDVAEGEERHYALLGWLRDDLDAEWDSDAPVIDISENLLGVLTLADPEAGWFIDREGGDASAAAG